MEPIGHRSEKGMEGALDASPAVPDFAPSSRRTALVNHCDP